MTGVLPKPTIVAKPANPEIFEWPDPVATMRAILRAHPWMTGLTQADLRAVEKYVQSRIEADRRERSTP